jgi:hypothetical protein
MGDGQLTQSAAIVEAVTGEESASVYKERFRDGAIMYPRMLIMVTSSTSGPLGVPQGRQAVTSRKTSLDKPPWKSLPPQEGVVESIFVHPALLGESFGPFRVFSTLQSVIPYDGTRLLDGSDERIDRYPGLADWWRNAETIWTAHRSSEKRTLLEQLDYMHQLSAQFPTSSIRVVYTKAGNTLCAAIVDDPATVIDHKRYWAPINSIDEARYLTAILNAPVLTEMVRPYQSVGAFGPRDFDKYVWQLPIPDFEPTSSAHTGLVALALEAEQAAEAVDLEAASGFQAARKLIRTALVEAGIANGLDAAVTALVSTGTSSSVAEA